VQVVQRLHAAIARLDEGPERMGFFIARKPDQVLRAAEASATRLAQGTARSVFEGVPVAVKDEVDLAGFATTLGTRFLRHPVGPSPHQQARLATVADFDFAPLARHGSYGDPVTEVVTQGLGNSPAARVEDES
jgi:hypothetical protein